MRTPSVKKEDIERSNDSRFQRRWYVVDASTQSLGRAASKIATILRGKHKPVFTPHVDVGDFVVVINAEKVQLTGNKLEQKRYYRHTGWPGGIKEETAKHLLARKPAEVMRHAVKGMLPKGRLGRQMIRKLKIYAGEEHPHEAQKPQPLSL